MSAKTLLVGLAGGSASGKTSIIKALSAHFTHGELAILSQDNYYKPLSKQKRDKSGEVNFDDPVGIDFNRLRKDINKLRAGKRVQIVEYTFNDPSRFPKQLNIEPAPIILVEGLFIYADKALKKRFDWRLFVHTDLGEARQRRIKRDVNERGMTVEHVDYQWSNHVLPAYDSFVTPHLVDVHLTIDNTDHYQEQLNDIVAELERFISQ